MKTIKSRFLLALTAVAMIVCLCFGIAACKKDKGKEKETFPAPSNVVIVGDSLKWDAVDEAAEYTVKINTDETTTTTNTTLDLTTVKTKLVSGENKLSVKVNETDKKNASGYSAEVTYTYTPQSVNPPPAPTPEKLATPEATVDGDTLKWNAVANATGYTVKIGEGTLTVTATTLDLTSDEVTALLVRGENSITVKANAGTGAKDSDYSTAVKYEYVVSSDVEAASFKTSVNAIGEVTLESAEKIAVAKNKYKALSDEAKAVEGVDAAIETLATKDGEYYALLVSGVDVDGLDTALTVEQKEAVDAAIAQVNAYYAGLIDNTKAATAKAALDAKVTAYEAVLAEIEEGIANLKETIEGLNLGGTISQEKATIEYYQELTGLKEDIENLEGYAGSLWADNNAALTTAVATEIENLLKAPATVEDSVEVFYNAVNGKITILYKATNVLGEVLVDNAPSLSVTTYAADTTIHEASFTGNDGVYYYTTGNVVVEEAKGDTEDETDYQLKVVYSIGGGAEKTVIYKKIQQNIYFDDTKDYKAVVEDTIHYSGAPGFEAYFDIYETSAIILGTGENTIPSITGFPLIKGVPVKNDMTVEAFRAYLARTYSDLLIDNEYEVRFVVYLTEKTGDGAIKISNIKNDLVSHDTYVLDLTEEDKKERLAFGNAGAVVWDENAPDPGAFIFGGYLNDAVFTSLKKQLGLEAEATNADVYNELSYVVTVTLDGVTKEFTVDSTDGSISSAVLKINIYNLFKNETATDYTVKVRLALREGSALSDRLKDSFDTEETAWNFTATLADTKLNIAGAIAGGKWSLGDKTGATNHSWEVSTTNTAQHKDADLHDGVNIYAYLVGDKDVQTYDFFANDEPFATYNHSEFSFAQWQDIDSAILKAVLELGANKPASATFVFVMQWIANEKAIKIGYSDSEGIYATASDDSIDTKTYTWDWNTPTGIQLRFSGAFFEFLRENQPASGNGSIFNEEYGVTMIEIEFTDGTTTYNAFLFNEDGTLNMYKTADKSGTVRDCDTLTNGYREVGLFEDWVKEVYGLESFSMNGWSFRTKVHHDGSYFVDAGEFSTSVTYNA